MSAGETRWTAEQVLGLAPDAASRKAGARLAAPGPWSGTGAGQGAVWGECRGSGSSPYRTVVDLAGEAAPGYRCSCPSRKFPCKHALGLLLLWAADGPGEGGEGVPETPDAVPDWAGSWLSGRRQRAERAREEAAAVREGERAAGPADPAAARHRAERRAARIAAGATELERRLADLLRGGLAGAQQSGYAGWDETAARMVDAQAPGLAARVRELGAVPGSGPGWPSRLLAECALLHLLDRAVLRLDELPGPLAATVRSRVGLTVETAEVLADRDALVRDRWLVLGRDEAEEGRVTARRVWLYGRESGRTALLLSFGAAGQAPPDPMLPVGSALDAELAFYPGARPLRAVLGRRHTAPEPDAVPPGTAVRGALAAYGAALCDDPWLDGRPAVLADVVPVPAGEGWQLADAEGEDALPVPVTAATRSRMWRLAAVSGGEPVTVFGECGHLGFTPYTVWTGTAADTASGRAPGAAIPLGPAEPLGGTA
ncbi:SWIM zinc finger family protein [Streptomyces sp. TRM 70361]|uniref:SWIM zinc finger family protein n=1 Tax=Streptomyces sp. TRM 70361 TaxID=3116553 RepID=UPI002E7BAC9D|nr:SWIM zinc finger family protein [Streptomyces sp. TRM 70361]MEE1939440.1 SWIM zinc finger family protein [Streptomyces sp. TRM 70361]